MKDAATWGAITKACIEQGWANNARLSAKRAIQQAEIELAAYGEPRFDQRGNRVNEDGSLWNLDGKLAARNQE